ncbi:MAG: FAD-dependent oxidoreductase [Prolixibacteraceae bacterium]
MRSLILSCEVLLILSIFSTNLSMAQNSEKWSIPAGGNSYLVKQQSNEQVTNPRSGLAGKTNNQATSQGSGKTSKQATSPGASGESKQAANQVSSGVKNQTTTQSAGREDRNTWNSADDNYLIFFKSDKSGKADLSVNLAVPEGKSNLTVRVGDKKFNLNVTGSTVHPVKIGRADLRIGYNKIEFQGTKKEGKVFATLSDLEVMAPGLALVYVKDNLENRFYWGRRGPSVHLNFGMPKDADIEYFYNEITVPVGMDPEGSYFMANGFGEGYFGMQVNGPQERRILFSVWSPFKTDRPGDIPEAEKIVLLDKGEGVHTGEFGNEGSGGQSYFRYPWKAGNTYKFLLKGTPDGKENAVFTAWFFAPEAAKWQLIASFKRPKTDHWLTRFHSFLENFNDRNGYLTRKGLYNNQWCRDKNGKWFPVTSAKFTADDIGRRGYRMDYAGGAEGQGFYLQNGGFFDVNTEINSIFELKTTPVTPPVIDFEAQSNSYKADLIIYGGTSAAVVAAVEMVKSGKSVLIVSPETHLGGLSSGGLGFTDTGNKSVIGGLSREFYHRVWKYYNDPATWKWQKQSEYGNKGQGTVAMDGESRTMWIFEPHIAEMVFEDFIKENNIKVFRNEWLDRAKGVVKKQGRIVSFKTLSGKTFSGKIFMDATYEGDLMASAGVSYVTGREACDVFNETWNGVQADIEPRGHFFKMKIDPYRIPGKKESGLIYGISSGPIAPNKTGDKKVQAYCYRICMSDNPDNRVPFPKPEKYDPANYELMGRLLDTGWKDLFGKFDLIPNRKTDTNNYGPFNSDFIGMNYDYPDASYERRKEILKEHENYQKGLFYYLCNDPRVPASVREAYSKWGLAKDEFVENGNWPWQLYIRESRRMSGVFVTTENEVTNKNVVKDPVGMGSYNMDSHNIQRYVTPDGWVQNEGDVEVRLAKPYLISFGSLLPKKAECSNLLVPVCVSSSHIAYGSIRMEPVFMILGQSAAITASIAIDKKQAVQDVDYNVLKQKLLEKKQVITMP